MKIDYSWDDEPKDSPRLAKVGNIIELIIFMQSRIGGVSIQDIMDRFGKSRRTAERMRDCVMDLCPVEEIYNPHEKFKRWGFTDYSFKEIVNFTSEEIATLEKLKTNSDDITKKDLENILDKVRSLSIKKFTPLSEIEQGVEALLQSEGLAISQRPKFKIDLKNVSLIRHGIKTKHKLKATYKGKEKLLSPLGMIYGEKVYLVAREEDKGQSEYVYQMHNLENVDLSRETFDPKGFNLAKYTERSFGVYQGEVFNVKLKFDESAKEDVTHYNFHPTQKIELNDDGTVTVTFRASGDMHILWDLFKWGDLVEIVEPKKLKNEYIDILQTCINKQKSK